MGHSPIQRHAFTSFVRSKMRTFYLSLLAIAAGFPDHAVDLNARSRS